MLQVAKMRLVPSTPEAILDSAECRRFQEVQVALVFFWGPEHLIFINAPHTTDNSLLHPRPNKLDIPQTLL